ncbi:IS110 family RNA-guided transposase [Aneurinibacillus migulanus]|uniref:Transposase n=1 Tax=Aneurinibacillus migulanus TaxID=47500 RepID=A0A0D1W6J5_ANEMI|nr:IS110 family transposase [Aneurinibacillus migulanus]KIV54055.1 transposase [Aneurinibacillus migulanus]KON97702.1 transposase [Aneurinibacillus migulanus]MED0894468.1 IS110 family transposase [Aneurinibacillus migulanus]MED1617078.1 IS110 family transposase [Aneurinibacillus migulanus]SDJ34356.1 Transposase [Aneurinibacillus migulanus]
MNYTQNHRIKQMNEFTLIVGADIAKHKHVARAQDFRGIEVGKPCVFDNSRARFNKLLHWIHLLMEGHSKTHVLFGIEPTGHYWMPLAQFLRHEGIKIVIVNPLHVKRSKELDDNSPTKNDVKDARVIAQLLKDGRYSEPQIPQGIYAELRVGMNMRERLSKDLLQVKGRIHGWLDRYFPEFLTVFKDWEGKAALLTLQNFPLPNDIVKQNAEEIVQVWKIEVKRAVGTKRALQLIMAAEESVGLKSGLDMAKQELHVLLSQYKLLCEQLAQCMERVERMVHTIPGATQMMTIPGVGFVTVAGFLAEVGDLNGYSHPRQIQKLAGFNLKENSSGKHKGRTRITKRGRPRLRALLYKCVMPLVAKNEQFKALHDEFTARTVNPLRKKQSLIALCCKLIRIFFALGRKQQPYDALLVIAKSQHSSARNVT